MGEWLFYIYIFTGLAGPDSHQRMPVVRCDNNNGIDIFIIKQPAVVHVRGDFLITVLEFLGFEVQELGVNITKCDYANALHFAEYVDVLFTLFAKTHDSDANVVVCPQNL